MKVKLHEEQANILMQCLNMFEAQKWKCFNTILSHFLFESFVTSTGTRHLQYSHVNVHNVEC